MLQSLAIENFRCFRNSRFENFGWVNLIGGQNNAGKTALLEALLLVNEPSAKSILFMKGNVRIENEYIYQFHPKLAWENMFFQLDKKSTISLYAQYVEGRENKVRMTCREKIKAYMASQVEEPPIEQLQKIEDSAGLEDIGESTLHISNGEVKTEITYYWKEKREGIKFGPLIFSNREDGDNTIKKTDFIPTGFKPTSASLARELDQTKLRNETDLLLQTFQIIDDSIEKIDTINIGEPRIYVFRKGEPPQPLNFLGDALNKVARIVLHVINNPNCILLIDEIENGIHHTNQMEFWQMLIKLAVEKEVQIFATSHSAEMIMAFREAAVANNQSDKVRYMELFRSKRTGDIVGNYIDVETLAYNFRNNNPYRGE